MARPVKRIVLKFGTGILTTPEASTLDRGQIDRLSSEVAAAVCGGYECLLVSSGAVGAGLMALGYGERPKDLAGIQACAAVGQSRLMNLYETAFASHGLLVAQLLLTYRDLDSRKSYANAGNTLNRLLAEEKVVPIINENDSVAVEELRFGDNDRLSAEVAMLAKADLLILLTSAEGLLNNGELVREVTDIDSVMQYAKPTKGKLSVGGMGSKLLAVKKAVLAGIPTVIASGRAPHVITSILKGEAVGTRFHVKEA
ncbi:MAG: glutamate 5-kinase [Chthoniobacteraceae bacterium]